VQLFALHVVPVRAHAPTPQLDSAKPSSTTPSQSSSTPLHVSPLGCPGMQLDARHEEPVRWQAPTPQVAGAVWAPHPHTFAVVAPQLSGAVQVPHATVPPHPSPTVPQFLFAHPLVVGTHTQEPAVQFAGAAHVPQLSAAPQALLAVPHVAVPHDGGAATVRATVLLAARSPAEPEPPFTAFPQTVSVGAPVDAAAVYTAEKWMRPSALAALRALCVISLVAIVRVCALSGPPTPSVPVPCETRRLKPPPPPLALLTVTWMSVLPRVVRQGESAVIETTGTAPPEWQPLQPEVPRSVLAIPPGRALALRAHTAMSTNAASVASARAVAPQGAGERRGCAFPVGAAAARTLFDRAMLRMLVALTIGSPPCPRLSGERAYNDGRAHVEP